MHHYHIIFDMQWKRGVAYGTMETIMMQSKWAWLKYAPSSGDPIIIVPIVPYILSVVLSPCVQNRYTLLLNL